MQSDIAVRYHSRYHEMGGSMYEAGDYIVYGSSGVCLVEAVGPINIPGTKKAQLYYTLIPQSMNGKKIYTPVDNDKVIIRAVISREEAEELVDTMEETELLWLKDEKGREQIYKEAMRTCDCGAFVRIIRTLYARKESRIADGKKVTSVDERYLHMAKELLYEELSFSLSIEKDEVEEYIINRIEKAEV